MTTDELRLILSSWWLWGAILCAALIVDDPGLGPAVVIAYVLIQDRP